MNGQSAPHTPSTPPPPPGGFFQSVRRIGIWRTQDRWAGGVAAGIGHRFGLDPLLVRGLFVVVTMFGGLGLILYGAAWALLPEASDGRIHLEQAARGDVNIALAGAAAVFIVGLSRPVFWWTASWWAVPWLVALVAIVALVLLNRDRGANRQQPPPNQTPGPIDGQSPPPDQPPATAPVPAASRPAYDVPEDTMPHATDTAGEPAPPTTDSAAELAPATTDSATESAPHATGADDVRASTDVVGPLSHGAAATERLPATEPVAPGPGGSTTHATSELPAADETTRHAPGTSTSPATDAGQAWHAGADTYADQAWQGGSGSAGGGGWDGAGGPGAPPPHEPPPTPPQPPVPGPGSRTTSLVLAVSLLGAAGIALAHHQGLLDANPWLLGGGAVLAVLGVGVVISGIRGRTQGGLGATAILLALVMVPTAAAAAALPGFERIGSTATTWAGDISFTPTNASDAENGYTVVAGELVVDLTELDDDAEVTVPVGVTFGNLVLRLPEEGDVTVNAEIGGGQVTGVLGEDWSGPNLPWRGPGPGRDSLINGAGVDTTFNRETDGPGPTIVVDAEVGFGQIQVEETS